MAVSPLTDEATLLARSAAGDEQAFTRIFRHYHLHLGRFVYKMTGSREVAEEIVQDAFVTLWLRREKLHAIGHLGNYLFAMCRNGTFAAVKKMAAERTSITALEKYAADEAAFELLDNPAEDYRQRIALAVDKLPEQQRKVYMMSRYDRMRYEDIAEQLGLSPATVKKHVQLAVRFIREDISGRDMTGIMVIVLTTPLWWL